MEWNWTNFYQERDKIRFETDRHFTGNENKTRSTQRNYPLVPGHRLSFLLRPSNNKSYVTRARVRLTFVCIGGSGDRGEEGDIFEQKTRRSRWSAERYANATRSSDDDPRDTLERIIGLAIIVFSAVAGRNRFHVESHLLERSEREFRESFSKTREFERNRKIPATISLVRCITWIYYIVSNFLYQTRKRVMAILTRPYYKIKILND